jgi:hypothetical protein
LRALHRALARSLRGPLNWRTAELWHSEPSSGSLQRQLCRGHGHSLRGPDQRQDAAATHHHILTLRMFSNRAGPVSYMLSLNGISTCLPRSVAQCADTNSVAPLTRHVLGAVLIIGLAVYQGEDAARLHQWVEGGACVALGCLLRWVAVD